jgi:hypothetical protein
MLTWLHSAEEVEKFPPVETFFQAHFLILKEKNVNTHKTSHFAAALPLIFDSDSLNT